MDFMAQVQNYLMSQQYEPLLASCQLQDDVVTKVHEGRGPRREID